ncbi:inovirus-type Gp2 protein [uncultured Tolumonas sp.]|uniref:YagK/YfjJ domain-containing protein n=1 Tax=uncultured Tolumonas sp. TaxID=263765 RepID=UPI0029307C7B|nr:inovirus-type Gp2 protein [uncultured Tolumonas sp.]
MDTNTALIEALDLPTILENSTYPYITSTRNYSILISHTGRYRLFDVLEQISCLIEDNAISDANHPTINLLATVLSNSLLTGLIANGELRHSPSQLFIYDLNRTLEMFRTIANSKQFRKQLANLSRMTTRNTVSLQRYVNDLFEFHSRLLVVRVDFHYLKSEYDNLSIEQATQDRDVFIRQIKREYRYLVGMCWKLEYGKDRAYHYHMVFFFNGAKVRQDITLGQQLGELWLKVTEGAGTYYNCNADKSKYDECYLGQINYDDTNKRAALTHASYLTKVDESIIAVQLNGKARIFGKMTLPKRASAAGRPRLRIPLI